MQRNRPRKNPSEDQIHAALVNYLMSQKVAGRRILFYHPPNGGSRNKIEGAKFKRLGVLKGVSDLVIAEPVGEYHGMYLEVKKKSGRLSEHQKEFLQNASDRGYATAVCYSVDEGINIINQYITGKYKKV